jgi:hypothetical protein
MGVTNRMLIAVASPFASQLTADAALTVTVEGPVMGEIASIRRYGVALCSGNVSITEPGVAGWRSLYPLRVEPGH